MSLSIISDERPAHCSMRDLFVGPVKSLNGTLAVPSLFDQAATPRSVCVDLELPAHCLWLLRTYLKRLSDARIVPTDQWGTPGAIWSAPLTVCGVDAYDLDAASCDASQVPAKVRFTGFPFDGRKESWDAYEHVLLNPPYSDPLPFVQKAIRESSAQAEMKVVGVFKDDHSTAAYRNVLASDAAIVELGRVRFDNLSGQATPAVQSNFPVILVLWGFSQDRVTAICTSLRVAGYPARQRGYQSPVQSAKKKRRGPRGTIDDPVALKRFIDIVRDGDLRTLSSEAERALAQRVLDYLEGRRSVAGICGAIARLTKDLWKGISAATLRDNYYRAPGTRNRKY